MSVTTLQCHTDFCVVADCGSRMNGVVGHHLWCCGMGGALVHTRLLIGLSVSSNTPYSNPCNNWTAHVSPRVKHVC